MSPETKVYDAKMQKTIEVVKANFASVRAGRANAGVLDRIFVEYYGTPTPLNQVAAISSPDPRTLMIQPWDGTLLKAIEKAIQTSDLGINPQNDGRVIRLGFPQLTEERRRDLTKQVHKYGEEGKVALRNIRREAMDEIKKQVKKSEITEDDQKQLEKELQDLTDKRCKEVDELTAKKEQELMAVLKANAYGHGLEPTADFLSRQGVRHFAVATVEEAKVIRAINPTAEILILGYVPPQRAAELSRLHLSLTLTSYDQACQLDQTGCPISAHLPVDTGMHRLGETAEDLDAIARYYALPHLQITGLYSHLYEADNLSAEAIAHTRAQIERFFHVVDGLKQRGIDPGRVHLQGSYGFLNYPELRCDLVRCGIALFGCIAPFRSRMALDWRPVASVRTRIAALRPLKKGEGAGYNHAWAAPCDTTVAILSIGYSDGLLRSSSFQGAEVLIHGQRRPIVGAMCMDQCLVDLSSLPAAVGDEVIVIGKQGTGQISALEVAEKTGTIVPETLSMLRGRMPRILV